MYSDLLSVLIKKASVYSHPGEAYFNSFIPRFKMYRKTKIIKQRILAFSGIIATIVVAYFCFTSITKDTYNIQTAVGIENVQPQSPSR